ncbi:MAG TPA: substrate-binding domain-containing protein [Polyangiaceae bacterium]|nr:substrate-binding domain-containing protein [Polyangiaceae bacterium]
MKTPRYLVWALCLCALLAVSCKKKADERHSGGAAADARALPRVAVIPKGTTHEFWKAVHAGAEKAAREVSVEVIWKGPLKEDDLKSQVDLVQSFTAQGVSGIVLAPLNDTALGAPVKAASDAKVPVVIFDSDLKDKSYVSFVATDNRAAGRLAGERMGKLLGGKGNVLVLRYQEGSASTNHREEGFLEAIRQFPEIKIASENRYGGATTESAHAASENLLLAQNAAKGTINGIFTPNESTTFGMLLALQKTGLAGKLHFIGFDSSEKLIAAVNSGQIDALVLQDPLKMGYLAVKTMAAHLRGQAVEARIDTGATLVDRDNLKSPEIAELVRPNLAKWLDAP